MGKASESEVSATIYNSENVTGMDPKFYTAAVEGKTDAFKNKGDEIELMLTPNGNTILHIHFTAYTVSEAFVDGILHMCPTLLKKPNAKGETLLHIAARYGHSTIVKKLIENAEVLGEGGARKNLIRAINDKKDTALHEAVCFNHMDIVDILTKEDPDYPYFGNNDGETPLYVAVERKYTNVAVKILENCTSPNQDGPNGRTALHAAVMQGDEAMVSKLLTRTSVKQADENGWVPLHLAAFHSSADMTEELLKYDRNTAYKRDKKGRTALHFAACCDYKDVMEKIIEYCPDCAELVDNEGYNALHYAVIGINPMPSALDAAGTILKNTSLSNLYNEKDKNGNTPLHHLVKTPNVYSSHPLLQNCPRVDTMAFNKQNQIVIDIASDNLFRNSSLDSEAPLQHLVKRLGEIGASYSGRIIKNKDDRKKKQKETHEHNSAAAERKKKQEKTYDPAIDETVRKKKFQKERQKQIAKARETSMLVATLIATVTFAAGLTMPGGSIQEHDQSDKGSPILMHNPAFKAFVITDSISFVLSASAMLIQSSSSFLPDDFSMYGRVMMVTSGLSMLAMVFMVTAFATGTFAVLAASKGLAVVTLLIGLSFFSIFGFITYFNYCFDNQFCGFPIPGDPNMNAKYIQLSEPHP